jgi:hypothetical protein
MDVPEPRYDAAKLHGWEHLWRTVAGCPIHVHAFFRMVGSSQARAS